MKKLSDRTILELLESDRPEDAEKGLEAIYAQFFPSILRYTLKNNGSESEAKDLFQDGIISFYTQVKKGNFKLTSSLKTYLFAVCRNLWLTRLKGKKRTSDLEPVHYRIAEETDNLQLLITEESQELLQRILQHLGEECQRLLVYFYFDRFRMREIARKMQFSSEQIAKNKKSKCMKKLAQLLEDQQDLKDQLAKMYFHGELGE